MSIYPANQKAKKVCVIFNRLPVGSPFCPSYLNLYSAAKNTQTGEDVAIKKVTKVFEKAILAKRALREVKLLRHFSGHENVSDFSFSTFLVDCCFFDFPFHIMIIFFLPDQCTRA